VTVQLMPEIKPSAKMSPDQRGCRFCGQPLEHLVVDLGMSPLCQSQVEREDLNKPELFYPLRAYVCDRCWLVQVHEHVGGDDIFSHYAYFSSYSDSWLRHAAEYVEMITERLQLNADSHVVELASNDGYLLKHFVAKQIPCLGVEPAGNVAQVAKEQGIPVEVSFFGVETAKRLAAEGKRADLMLANNCLAHVPDLNDFVGGMKLLLASGGVLTVEYPHLLNIIEQNQFDTIYQEHYCYHSLLTLEKVFAHHGMKIFDVEEIPTHGGSLRIYVGHQEDAAKPVTAAVVEMRQREIDRGLTDLATFEAFAERVKETKWKLLEFLIEARRQGKRVVGYGAPGKGNTMLNYCGIREDLLDFTVDRNPFKQNSYLVGSRIPVYTPEAIDQMKPDYVLILPWNLRDEIVNQLSHIRRWGGQFVVAIPELEIC